jgi:hypothetical protein
MSKPEPETMSKVLASALLPAVTPDVQERAVALANAAENAAKLTEVKAMLDIGNLGAELIHETKREKFEALLPDLDAKISELNDALTAIGTDLEAWVSRRVIDAEKRITPASKALAPYAKIVDLFEWSAAANIKLTIAIQHSVSSESDFRNRVGYGVSVDTLNLAGAGDPLVLHYVVQPTLNFGAQHIAKFAKIFIRAAELEKDKALVGMVRKARSISAELRKVNKRRKLIAVKASRSYAADQIARSDKMIKAAVYGKALDRDIVKIAENDAKNIMDKELAEIDRAVGK